MAEVEIFPPVTSGPMAGQGRFGFGSDGLFHHAGFEAWKKEAGSGCEGRYVDVSPLGTFLFHTTVLVTVS